MVSRPLVCLALSFACGIALSAVPALPVPPRASLLAALALAVVVAALFLVLRKNVFPLLAVVFLLLGTAAAGPSKVGPGPGDQWFDGQVVELEGYICREPEIRGDKTVYDLEVEKARRGAEEVERPGRALLFVPGRRADLGYGDGVRVEGRPYLPGSPGNPGQFDYRAYLSGWGIWALVSVEGRERVEKTGSGRGSPAAAAALGLKQRLMEINRATLGPEHASLVNGIVFGSRGEISPRTTEVFNEAGVVHILSVSGLHVGLVAAGTMGLLGVLGLQRFSFPVLTAVLAFYAYLTGMGPAVVRAAAMAWIYLLGRRLGRDKDWPTVLAAAALAILIFSPRSLFDPGFQLSFAATWGILHPGAAIDRKLESMGLTRPWARGCLSVSLGAQLGTIPLIACYYNIFSLISVPANLLAVPLVGMILPLGLAASLAGLAHLKLALLINYANEALLDLMMLVVGVIHSIPGGVCYIPPPPPVAVAAWYASLFLLFGAARGKRRDLVFRLLAGGILVFSAAASFAAAGVPWGRNLEVHVIDVGQGDSILVRFANGRDMLVDAGGWKDEFREGRGAGEVVASYLRRLGLKRLDVLVITHPHEDHAAGAAFLLGRFDIGAVLVSPADISGQNRERADPSYGNIISLARERNIPVRELFSGDMIALDPAARVEVLGPGLDLLAGTRSDLNNNSLVISVRYGLKSFLLTGDIEVEGQARLIERGVWLGHSVIKLPHHGSRYVLPEFIDRVRPEITVVSVGKNSFGQPDAKTVALAGSVGRKLYRTDRDGLVLFSCDGRKIGIVTGKQVK